MVRYGTSLVSLSPLLGTNVLRIARCCIVVDDGSQDTNAPISAVSAIMARRREGSENSDRRKQKKKIHSWVCPVPAESFKIKNNG
jgi:hypothetical protein